MSAVEVNVLRLGKQLILHNDITLHYLELLYILSSVIMHIVFSAIFLFIRCVFPSSSKWILDWIKLVWRVSKYQFSYWSSHGSNSGLISVEIEISHWWRQEGQLAGVAEVLQKSQSTISVGMPNGAVHDVKSIFLLLVLDNQPVV